LDVGLTTLPCKKENCREACKKFSRIESEEDCGGGQGLSWAVEPTRERERERLYTYDNTDFLLLKIEKINCSELTEMSFH
jgi:hypothetical protein